MKRYLFFYLCVLIVSFGGFLSGFDTGVISGAMIYIQKSFNINSISLGFLVSSISLGAVIGALINGFLVDKYGRKKILLLVAIVFAFGSIFCSISQNILQLVFSRIIIGFAVGVVSFVAPLYLSEISIKEKRGQIVSFYQLSLTFGILFSYFVNYLCSFSEFNWRLMLLVGAFPALILFFGMLFQNETPRWLVLNNQEQEARNTFTKLNFEIDFEKEIENIKNTQLNQNVKITKKILKPLLIGIGIMFCQIATGINAIIYYTPTIFKLIGFNSNQEALIGTIIIGFINFLMTFVAIVFVDKVGRKPLLYFGLLGMMFGLLVLSSTFIYGNELTKYLGVFACAIYIISFSMSLGPIALLLISEIFPLKYRGCAMSISIVTNFIFNFIVTGVFPILLNKIGGCLTFLSFAFICFLSILFVRFFIPETKSISLEEIEMKYGA